MRLVWSRQSRGVVLQNFQEVGYSRCKSIMDTLKSSLLFIVGEFLNRIPCIGEDLNISSAGL